MARQVKDLTGQKFGRLAVLERAEDFVSPKTGRKQAAWKCQCDCGNVINVRGASLNSGSTRSCGCSRKKAKKENVEHLTPKEKEEEDALYKYVKNIMGYDNNQNLTGNMVLRLKGLRKGKFIENKKISDNANYSYEVILNTFKYCSIDINKALAKNSFEDEWHKFLYITKIVENNLNTVYVRMKGANKAEEKTKSVDVGAIMHQGASYQRKTDDNISDRLKDLW